MFRRGRSGQSPVDQADDRDVVEVAVARRLIVEQMHAGCRRFRDRRERLLFDPSPHGEARSSIVHGRIVVRPVGGGQRGQHVDDRRARPALCARVRLQPGSRSAAGRTSARRCLQKSQQARDLH